MVSSSANEWLLGSSLVWTAARGFDIGVDIQYAKLNQHLTANPGALPTFFPLGVKGVSPSALQGTLRLQRSF